jgi:ribosome recycling factor
MRREAKEFIEEREKEQEISEDDMVKGFEELQKLTDDYTKKTEEVASAKEKEIMQV